MRPFFVIVSTPSLHLFARIRKGQEPMRVQALGPKLAIECLDEAVIGRFSGPREVQGDVVGVGPKVEVARDELAAIVDPDRFGVTSSLADTLQRLNHVLTAIGETCVGGGAVARVRVDHGQDAQLLAGRELVVNKVHRPDIVRPDRLLVIVSEFCLHPTLGMLVAQLKT